MTPEQLRKTLDELESTTTQLTLERVGVLLLRICSQTEAAFNRAKHKDPETRQKLLDILNENPDFLEVILAESVNSMLVRICQNLKFDKETKTIEINFDNSVTMSDTLS